ncbi:MAG TPA: hypothetical protein VF543_06720 [Pyrinomonadaceae bacterium]|jgi:hypothetical protein
MLWEKERNLLISVAVAVLVTVIGGAVGFQLGIYQVQVIADGMVRNNPNEFVCGTGFPIIILGSALVGAVAGLIVGIAFGVIAHASLSGGKTPLNENEFIRLKRIIAAYSGIKFTDSYLVRILKSHKEVSPTHWERVLNIIAGDLLAREWPQGLAEDDDEFFSALEQVATKIGIMEGKYSRV